VSQSGVGWIDLGQNSGNLGWASQATPQERVLGDMEMAISSATSKNGNRRKPEISQKGGFRATWGRLGQKRCDCSASSRNRMMVLRGCCATGPWARWFLNVHAHSCVPIGEILPGHLRAEPQVSES
jgi:hypothetical protein